MKPYVDSTGHIVRFCSNCNAKVRTLEIKRRKNSKIRETSPSFMCEVCYLNSLTIRQLVEIFFVKKRNKRLKFREDRKEDFKKLLLSKSKRR